MRKLCDDKSLNKYIRTSCDVGSTIGLGEVNFESLRFYCHSLVHFLDENRLLIFSSLLAWCRSFVTEIFVVLCSKHCLMLPVTAIV